MKRKRTGLSVVLFSMLIVLPGCEQENSVNEMAVPEHRQSESPEGTAMPSPIVHTETGTVTAVSREVGRITIDHDPIPSLDWPSMTMSFEIDARLLDNVQTRDKVTFTLVESDNGQYVIQDIRRQ